MSAVSNIRSRLCYPCCTALHSTALFFLFFCVHARFWSLLSFKTRHIMATAQSERIGVNKECKGEEEDQNKKERGIDYKLITFCAFYGNAPTFYKILSLGRVEWQKQHATVKDLIIILEISPRNKINPPQWLPSLKELSRLRCLPSLYSFVFPILYWVNMTTQRTRTHTHKHSCLGIVSAGRHTWLRRR